MRSKAIEWLLHRVKRVSVRKGALGSSWLDICERVNRPLSAPAHVYRSVPIVLDDLDAIREPVSQN